MERERNTQELKELLEQVKKNLFDFEVKIDGLPNQRLPHYLAVHYENSSYYHDGDFVGFKNALMPILQRLQFAKVTRTKTSYCGNQKCEQEVTENVIKYNLLNDKLKKLK